MHCALVHTVLICCHISSLMDPTALISLPFVGYIGQCMWTEKKNQERWIRGTGHVSADHGRDMLEHSGYSSIFSPGGHRARVPKRQQQVRVDGHPPVLSKRARHDQRLRPKGPKDVVARGGWRLAGWVVVSGLRLRFSFPSHPTGRGFAGS
jgi:hypothetical protein